MLILVALGLVAGLITTTAGVGGGMLLTVALAALLGPKLALATAAPALLLGNAHRLWLFRSDVEWRTAALLAAGALPGAVLGGVLAVSVPNRVLGVLLVTTTVFAFARHRGWLQLPGDRAALVPMGAVAGALTATSGGGGMLLAPTLLATGIRADSYVATGAAVAVLMHVGRLVAYGAGGIVDARVVLNGFIVAAAILVGNTAARRLRARLSEKTKMRVAYAALLSTVLLSFTALT